MLSALSPLVIAKSPMYVPPKAVSACLSGADIYAAGPSELAAIVGWLTGGDTTSTRRNTEHMRQQVQTGMLDNTGGAMRSLACQTRFNLGDRHWQCPQRDYRVRSQCREDLFASKPFEARCSGTSRSSWDNASFRIFFAWKSYQFTRADRKLRDRVQRAIEAAHSRRTIVVLSAGLQQFSTFADHSERLLHNVRDDEVIPQRWIDDWLNQTDALLRLFSPSRRRWGTGPPPCVVWRAQNVAQRHANASEPRHHPSAINGVHHWLNRMGLALARLHGLKTIDLTNITIALKPQRHSLDAAPSAASRQADALEGDVYHGYPVRELARPFLSALAGSCCRA